MKVNIEKFTIAILTVAILSVSYVALTGNLMVFSETSGGIKYTGMVCYKVTRVDGTIEDYGCGYNVLTNLGENITTRQLFNEPSGISATDYVNSVVLGNTSDPVATDESHPGKIADCGLDEAGSMTWTSTGTSDGNVTNSTTWTSTCNSVVVNTTGLETATGSTYFAGKLFANPVTLQSNDQLTVTWYVWVTGT